MQQPSESPTCPTCQSPIPVDAPGGLCPACTLEKAASVPPTGTGGRHAPPPSIEEIAPHFPELEILELLGAGGMGAVYKARQPQLDRTVALKILSRELAQEPAFVERFNREAKVLARLSHPNIVAVFDFGTAGSFCFLLMEYVDGVNLRQAMRTGGFTPTEALALVGDMCSALQFAHEEGILHRDIKPENVLIDSKGRVKIADFGIAKLLGPAAPQDVTLTLQGSILGSPHYMAPEQIEAPGDVDHRADIYSLGVVLYEMLTGELPIGRFALPSEKAAMDARIDQIVLRTLEKERGARFQSAAEVETQVQALGQSPLAGDASPDPVATRKDRPNRSALAAAIVAATSLVLVLAAVLVEGDFGVSAETEKLILMIALASGACLGILGTIFGAKAAGSIWRSGGQRSGLRVALCAAAVWPLLLAGVLITNSFSQPSWEAATETDPVTINWHKGAPDLMLPVTVAPHLRARFQLKYFDGYGREELAEIGELIPTGSKGVPALRAVSTLGAPQAILAFGTSEAVDGGPDGGFAITGMIEGSGQSGSLRGSFNWEDYWDFEASEFPPGQSLKESLERPYGANDFNWNMKEIGRLHVSQSGQSSYQIAANLDGFGALRIVIVATER